MEIAFLVVALGLGLAARAIGLPPLVGYLAAGFLLHAVGYESTAGIEAISEIGILLLLFGIGLKLEFRTLTRPQVWGTATSFAVVMTAVITASLLGLGALGVPLARDLDLGSAAVVGFALSFSSTVFAVKALETTGETASLAGRLAVGVLILQDIFAVGFLVAVGSGRPSPWALLVLPAIIVQSDHGEILVLLGFALAIGVGAGSFELLDLKPDLGALVAGLMLSGHARAGEMADRLLGFKDLFLVGFFLSIGLGGAPSPAAWAIGLLALILVGGKTVGFFWLFTRFRLRARTALHGALTLSTYSEFGLIVAAAALAAGLLDQQWVSTIGVAVALSFVVVSAVSAARYRIYERWSRRLISFERHPPLPEDAVIDCGTARVLIFGMGRVGAGAYDEMVARWHELSARRKPGHRCGS
jgi:predicted Kef-type K+ transport protein